MELQASVPPPGDPATLKLLREVMDRAPAGAVFSGRTAAWLHGLEIDPCHPIEMILPLKPAQRAGAASVIRPKARRRR